MTWYAKRTKVTGETWEDHARALEAQVEWFIEEMTQTPQPILKADQLAQEIARGEGQNIEFKQSFAEKKEAIESLCAFANAEGGTVFLGIRDDGSI